MSDEPAPIDQAAELPDVAAMTPDQRRAFYVYLNTSSTTKTGRRSLNHTATTLEIPIGTIRSWHTNHRWASLAATLDRTADAESMQVASVAAAALRPHIVSWLAEIAGAKDPNGSYLYPARERIPALRQLSDMTGLTTLPPPVSTEEEPTYAGHTQADLDRLASSTDPHDQATLLALATGRPAPQRPA